jgi:hypothetical protein
MSLDFVKEQVYSLPLNLEPFDIAHPIDVDAFLVQSLDLCLRYKLEIDWHTLRHHIPAVNFMVDLEMQLQLLLWCCWDCMGGVEQGV